MNQRVISRFNEINEYISIRITKPSLYPRIQKRDANGFYEERCKVIIYIGNSPTVTIPNLFFPSFKVALQDINEIKGHNQSKNKNSPPEIIFQRLSLSLCNWVGNNYDTQLLHFKIAFPLLKRLKDVGTTKFQIILQQEILKRFASSSFQVKEFLKKKGYLNLISDFF